VLVALACAACVRSGEVVCSDGRLCPPGFTCDDDNQRCLSQEQVAACNGLAEGADCSFGGAPGACRMGACEALVCGDGVRSVGEACDGSDFGGADCTAAGFYNPDGLACSSFCTFDVASCTGFCGDNTINGDELCDGVSPPGTCFDLGFDAGPLACAQSCGLSFSSCARFGWVPELVGVPNTLGMAGSSTSDIWVIGQDLAGVGSIAHYDGSGWTRQSTSSMDLLLAVAAISTTDAWIARTGATLMQPNRPLHYDGSSWSTVAGAPSAQYTDVWAASSNAVYFATRDLGVQWWNGTTWQALGTLAGPVLRLDGSSPSDIWAATGDGTLHRWNGTMWNALDVPVAVRHIDVRTPTSVWVAGASTVATAAAVAHWNGTSFTTYTNPSLSSDAFSAIVAVSDNDVWVAGPLGQAHHFDGQRWVDSFSRVTTDLTANLVELMHIDNIVFGAAFNGFIHRYRGQMIARLQTGSAVGLISLWSASPNDTFATDLRGGVHRYDGMTWTRTLVDSTMGTMSGIWGSGPSDVWATGVGGRVFHWDGNAWSLATTLGVQLPVIWGTGPSDVWFLGAGAYHYDGSMFTSLTAGVSGILGASGSGPNDVWAIAPASTTSTNVLRWNGTMWTNTVMQHDMHAIVVVANDVFITADTNHVLHYDGMTWTDTTLPVATKLDRLAASARDDVIAASTTEAVHFDGTQWTPLRAGSEGNGTLRALTAAPAHIDFLFTGVGINTVRRIVRTRFWNCRAMEQGCTDGVDDDCDGAADALDSDCP
jgi:hypothetical protein